MRRSILLFALVGALVVAVPLALADTINCRVGVYCKGTPGSDDINGTPSSDGIGANSGADVVHGYGDFDYISGATGEDRIYGGTEGDTIFGGHGGDRIYGEAGADELYAGCDGGCDQTGEWGDIINGGGSADKIGAQNGKKDFVHCGGGAGGDDHAWLDWEDELLEGHDCEQVHRS